MGPESNGRYDIVVIGGGTAGLVTAAGSAYLGARVLLVERDRLGGECLWTGCVPSKALIGSARIAEGFRRAARFGVDAREPQIDGGEILRSVRRARARVQPHDDPSRFRKMGVEVLEGETARFESPGELKIGERRVEGRKIVIATGTKPMAPPIDGLEDAGYFTHETAFEADSLPGSVVILGGGPIGVEFAQAYRRLGAEVTLVEREDRILLPEDPDLASRLREVLEEEGVRVLTGARAVSAGREGELRTVTVAASGASSEPRTGRDAGAGAGGGGARRTLRAEQILVAVGTRPVLESLNLEAAGVETGEQGVVVDEKLRTSRKHIFAAGDVTGGLKFTHVADHEARTVVRNALFPFSSKVDYSAVPWTTYSEPELAHVGLTEAEARERHGDSIRAYTHELEDLDRAIVDRATRGMVKLVADRRGRLLGGHVLAPDAGTMIVEVGLAMKHGIRISKLADLVHPYPTMSEGVRAAAREHQREMLTDSRRRWLDRYFRIARRLHI